MPGRTSVRANARSRTSEVTTPRKASAQSATTKSRASSTRNSALAVQIPDEGEASTLREHVCSVFSDAQRGTATQRKSVVTLRKIQEFCCYETNGSKKHQLDQDYDENEFNEEMGRCVYRILGIRKSESVGDRLVKFLGLFLKHASEKDNAIFQSDAENAEGVPETPTSRLTTHVLAIALNVIAVKDKVVRYRATQLIAHIVNTLESIDDQLFHLIRLALLKRLRDKESIVRVQAVLGLGPLADEDDEDADEDDSDDDTPGGVLSRLREALQHDPSADVRRALLLNLPFTPGTLPFLLERARDLDAATRRALYARLLPALGDFRHLSLTHREKLLRWGLRDRDENVRKATARLFSERWIEDCAPAREDEGEAAKSPSAVSEPSIDALLELLERIDVNNSGLEGGIAHEAMREFWNGRPDYQNFITFEDPFFDELTAESAFIARTFTDYCRKSGETKLQSMVEDKMPEVTKFAFLLQLHLNRLVEAVNKVALSPDDVEAEEDAVQQEFCIEQLLHIALTLDYSDEMGRRKMFQIMREALALAELPDECTRLVIEILRAVSGSEEEFASIVLEAIAEVHDTISEDDNSAVDDSFHSARSDVSQASTPTKNSGKKSSEDNNDIDDAEKAVREIQVNLKCLHIAQCMLQNVQSNLEQSSHLKTMLNNLVVPAVRSQEAPIRERGLKCMGLCCLLSKNLAEENLTLFLHCFNKGHDALQDIAIQIISDILITHPSLLAAPPAEGESEVINPLVRPVHKMYSKGLRAEDKHVATTASTALSKLMLASTITDSDLLRQMILAYFDPETQGNPGLRQALTYFLPVYCHSRMRNAEALARVAVPVLHALAERAEEMEEEEEMIGITLVAAQICDWTDPRKAVTSHDGSTPLESATDGHTVLAEELLEKILTPGCSKDERKTYIALLGKLHISATVPADVLQNLFDLVNETFEGKAVTETAARNTLTKLQNNLSKLLTAAGASKETSADAEEEVVIGEDGEGSPARGRQSGALKEEAGAIKEEESELEEAGAIQQEEGDGEQEEDVDETMMTKFTGIPDAEGTRFMDDDDDEEEDDENEEELDDDDHDDDDDDLLSVGSVRIKKEGKRTSVSTSVPSVSVLSKDVHVNRGVDESLVESLLDDDGDTIME